MRRLQIAFTLVLCIGSLLTSGCLWKGQGLLSFNNKLDDEKMAAAHASMDREIDKEIPAQSGLTLTSRSRLSRLWDKFRKPKRMTLPRTDEETLLTATDDADSTSF